MLSLEIKLGSALVHMVEYHETGEPADLVALQGILSDPEVHDFIKFSGPLLPQPRKPLKLLDL